MKKMNPHQWDEWEEARDKLRLTYGYASLSDVLRNVARGVFGFLLVSALVSLLVYMGYLWFIFFSSFGLVSIFNL